MFVCQTYVTSRDDPSRNLEWKLRCKTSLYAVRLGTPFHDRARINHGRLLRLSRHLSGLLGFAVAAVGVLAYEISK